ncbi:MAG: hypothetical protein R3279_00515 [Putridiphycobacter sp.]|nr:hypothetical protein [Putridiphycobacter sp.]
MKETISATLIEKEQIPQLKFKNAVDIEQSPELMTKLMEATRLGNIHHGKIRIEFMDDDGLKSVETTIWATGAKYICLKGGIWLPISRIVNIKNI